MKLAISTTAPTLVLGMHRSGTSLLAKLLHESGINMGNHFLETRGGNPGGVYEDAHVVDWHEAVLKNESGGQGPLCGMNWLRRGPVQPEVWERTLAQGPFPQPTLQASPWGWKDPRTLLFLEQWNQVYPDLRGIVIFRHPVDVYASFLRRGDFAVALDPCIAFETYAVYHGAAWQSFLASPESYYFIYADLLIENWNEEVERLSDWLGISLNRAIRPEPDAFHPWAGTSESDRYLKEYCGPALNTYEALANLSKGDQTQVLDASFGEDCGSEDLLLRLERTLPMLGLTRRRHDLRLELGQSLEKIGDEWGFFEGKQRFYEEEIGRLREHVRVLEEQHVHLSRQVEFMKENAGVEAWKARRSIMEMRQTVSWKITYPLRWLRQGIAGRWGSEGKER